MSLNILTLELTDTEIDNLYKAVDGDDKSDFRDKWKSDTRENLKNKVRSAITLHKQKSGKITTTEEVDTF